MNIKYCFNCGYELFDNCKFCPNCGKEVTISNETDKSQSVLDDYSLSKGDLTLLGFLSFIFPVFGILFYYNFKNKNSQASDVSGTWTILGFLAGIIIYCIYKSIKIRIVISGGV